MHRPIILQYFNKWSLGVGCHLVLAKYMPRIYGEHKNSLNPYNINIHSKILTVVPNNFLHRGLYLNPRMVFLQSTFKFFFQCQCFVSLKQNVLLLTSFSNSSNLDPHDSFCSVSISDSLTLSLFLIILHRKNTENIYCLYF